MSSLRSPSMRLIPRLLPLLLVALPALAQTPAERASRQLEQGERRDRADEAAEGVRGITPIVPPAQVLPLEADRRSLQPDVGRPEEAGAIVLGCTGLAGHAAEAEDAAGIPVIEPCRAAGVLALRACATPEALPAMLAA